MIDRLLVLSSKEHVKNELSKKGFDSAIIDELEQVLLRIRALKTSLNELSRYRNEVSRETTVSNDEKRDLRTRIAQTVNELVEAEKHANELLYSIPNLPEADAPVGLDASDNVIISQSHSHYACRATEPKPHWHIAESLGILDTKMAGRISGSRFALFKGRGAKLLRALVNYCMSMHEEKYLEILPPHLVSSESLRYTGHLPRFAEEQYKCIADDLWLIPTAEVPLTAAYAGRVFSAGSLPQCFMGYTLAFRRETSSSGKENRGLQRIHEFHKVELLKIAEPESVQAELDDLLEDCLRIIKDLQLEYRVVDLCTGDMGDKYARCYDIEVYAPGIKKWLEVSSVGHFSDYQARRAGIEYVNSRGKKKLAYTLNGSGIATPRVWAAIVETYQNPDGSVSVPEALVPLMGCDTILRK